ncbi:MAG: hypothetical protein U9N52_07355 [Campylobacterota bacterium]|nr:hypothetical protein [Campylobacterota bacterium]
MFNKFLTGVAAISLAATMAIGAEGIRFNVTTDDVEEKYNTMINEKTEAIGFILSDPHARINDGYKEKYGKTRLDNLGFFSIANDEALRELLLKEPSIGGFAPFNLHIYKEKNEKETYVGHVTPCTMMDIVGVEDKEVRKAFKAQFESLDKLVHDEIGGKVQFTSYDKLPDQPMMTFEIPFERGEDLDDFIDEFQEGFEEAFEEQKYIIAGYKNFKEAYDDMEADFDRYDAYWVYSLCHFKFSEGVFNQGRPDAGAFAPCSMYMYIEKDSNKLIVGMPKLANWTAVAGIKDKKMVDSINVLDKEIVSIMEGLGAKSL